ncbi:ATP-binding protein [Geoalkalibacter halelectricus]|uniref:histidine kinase n=1 Tax=Geoalkalibacter halelectricus TaxID=2847045 RepID=A0ABY5ZL10_9BACT|nr:ATP-binding protein [Geoalkalibacter halelectricus]MDO3378884.1 ATP-binding protein [Geoalkalibacter halelectricus]UWZ79813.1 ATP-binding protein [Geoalkalibacter halelectricus]
MRKKAMGEPSHYAIKGLRKKILLSSVLYTLAALLLISALSIYPLYTWMRPAAEANLTHAAEIRALAVEEYLSRMVEITRQINSRTAARNYLADYSAGKLTLEQVSQFTTAILKDALEISTEAVSITRFDREGRTIAHIGKPLRPELDISLSSWYQQLKLMDLVAVEGQLFLAVKGPIRSTADRSVIGHDIVMFTTTSLQRILWQTTGLGTSGESWLARPVEESTVVFFPSHRATEEVYNLLMTDWPLQPAVTRAAKGKAGSMKIDRDHGYRKKAVAYTPVAGSNWVLLVSMSEQELMAPLYRQILMVAALVLTLTILGTLGMLALLRPMTGRVMVYTKELDKLNSELTQEVAEREKAEARLQRSQREWEKTFEAITDAVVIRDTQGRLLKMNQATQHLLGELAPGQSPEQGCRALFGFDKPASECLFCRMIETREAQCGEQRHETADRWFHIACYPLFDDDQTLWGGVLIAQDVSEQKKMERIKDEMISSVSHEMRTPLTAMLGFVEFMLENPVDREQQIDFLQTIHRETERLNELVSNFLDLQRLQAQLEAYQFREMDICALLHETAHLFKVASKKHQVSIQCPGQLPTVRVDENRLLQALKNLLSNAIKYSPAGGAVVIAARPEGDHLVVSVRDQGMGIPPHARERIFERFYRADDSSRPMPGGIGLGLSLVREVIKAHGGEVWVESEEGKGSKFYFSLPVVENKAEKEKDEG